MVNLDMMGRPLVDMAGASFVLTMLKIDPRNAIGIMGARDRPGFQRIVAGAEAATGLEFVAPDRFPQPIAALNEEQANDRSDNGPFERAGIPTLFFGSGESDDYHRPTDVLGKFDPVLMAKRARAVGLTVLALSRATRPELPARAGLPR